MNVYEVLQSNHYTPNYRCPDSAARTSNGSILIESYTDNKWRYDLVKPYWDEIRNSRGNDVNHVSIKDKTMRNKIKRERRNLIEIKSQLEQIEANHKVAQLEVSVGDDSTSVTASSIYRTNVSIVTTSTYQANLPFGGKISKKLKK